ncbi:MAG: hypothetical protein DRJ97_02965 [Thermoprotei archaeon]|nr:MAG: hypothetical protein DRJ97_02965 [Thermoprotei archaeon]
MKGPWRIAAELYWCRECGVPLLEPRCNLCGAGASKLHATPPRDVRPALSRDLKLAREVVEEELGREALKALLPQDKVVLLNKVPYVDQADEVIVDGWPVGTLYFNPELSRWRFKPSPEGAARMWRSEAGFWAQLRVNRVRQWSRLTRSDFLKAELPGRKGSYVYLVSRQGHPVGLAVDDGDAFKVVKAWQPQKPHDRPCSSSWAKALRANEEALEKAEARARAFLASVKSRYASRPIIISFSGGKDSLASLILSLKELGDAPLLFNDTGLEMPETVKHVEEAASKYSLELLRADAGDAFWRSLDSFGPPSRDYRWCCKVCKLIPISRLLKARYPGGIVSIVGQRRYESFARAKSPAMWRSKWVANSVGASPVNEWSALHVWLYLMRERAEPNPLYEAGFDRVGCWLCPACELAEFKLVEELHPELWNKWEGYLKEWARLHGYPEAWATMGFWRWRKLPGDQRRLAARLHLDLSATPLQTPRGKLRVITCSGFSPCAGEAGLEASLSPPPPLARVKEFAPTVASKPILAAGTLLLKSSSWSATLSADGRVTVKANSSEEAKEALRRLVMIAARALHCSQCSSCIAHCPSNACSLEGEEVSVDPGKCTGCGVCNNVCPAASYIGTSALAGSFENPSSIS